MVEGAPLLREYTGDRIEGSNPFVSAIYNHFDLTVSRGFSSDFLDFHQLEAVF